MFLLHFCSELIFLQHPFYVALLAIYVWAKPVNYTYKLRIAAPLQWRSYNLLQKEKMVNKVTFDFYVSLSVSCLMIYQFLPKVFALFHLQINYNIYVTIQYLLVYLLIDLLYVIVKFIITDNKLCFFQGLRFFMSICEESIKKNHISCN